MGDDWLDGVDFEAIETAVKQTALRVAAQAVAHRLNADHSDQKGPRHPVRAAGKRVTRAGARRLSQPPLAPSRWSGPGTTANTAGKASSA